jgi:hypothetical protein
MTVKQISLTTLKSNSFSTLLGALIGFVATTIVSAKSETFRVIPRWIRYALGSLAGIGAGHAVRGSIVDVSSTVKYLRMREKPVAVKKLG